MKILRRERFSRALTQAEMARVLGVSKQLYNLWEQGKRVPNARNLIKIIDTLGLSLADVRRALLD